MDPGVCGVNGCFKNTALFLRNHVARGEDSSYLHTSVGADALASASAGTLGVIAQLVERLNGIEEVWGSNPHGSTKRLSASAVDWVKSSILPVADKLQN